jgi:hypothetical protein
MRPYFADYVSFGGCQVTMMGVFDLPAGSSVIFADGFEHKDELGNWSKIVTPVPAYEWIDVRMAYGWHLDDLMVYQVWYITPQEEYLIAQMVMNNKHAPPPSGWVCVYNPLDKLGTLPLLLEAETPELCNSEVTQ